MFYTTNQNNSGGYFIRNEDVCEWVIVEANNPSQANELMQRVTENYSEYCPCCGERWYFDFDERDGKENPMIYDKSVYETEVGMFTERCIIYYLDGRKEIVNFREKVR